MNWQTCGNNSALHNLAMQLFDTLLMLVMMIMMMMMMIMIMMMMMVITSHTDDDEDEDFVLHNLALQFLTLC